MKLYYNSIIMNRLNYLWMVLFMFAASCAKGSDGSLDTVTDDGTEAEPEAPPDETDEDVVEDETPDVPADEPDEDAADQPEADQTTDPVEEDPALDDPAVEDPPTDEAADPCTPNPCTAPPADECVSATVLNQWQSPGTCTPSGGTFTCDYASVDVDCAASGGMACIEGACTHTLEQVRSAPVGPVSFSLSGLYVTYVRPAASSGNGFYVQKVRTGPGLFMALGSVSPSVQVGNLIDVEITNVADDHGLREADAFTVTANDAVARDVTFLVQDFTGGGAVNESTESELLRINNARVVSGWTLEARVTFGASSSTRIYYDALDTLSTGVCPGMVLDIQAPAGEFDTTYRLTPFRNADFLRLDATACGALDNSNWDFEDWTYADPPEDFLKMTEAFTAAQETSIVSRGSASAALTWTSIDNQDFYQAWFTPVTSGTLYTYHVWTFDNDLGGRGRTAIAPYDTTMTPQTKDYGSYTSDTGAWAELTHEFTPALSGFMTPFVRLYDVSGSWDGSSTIYIDDWALTVRTSFTPSDGTIDTWTATDPASAPLLAGTPGVTMEIHGALSDAGVLYAATNEVTAGLSDHVLYVWVGGAHATSTVPAPWSKGGTAPAPAAGAALFALVQEESTGYCEVRRWSTTITDWAAVTAACGYDGAANGTGFVEASVDLVSVLGLVRARDIAAALAFAVAPYGTADGGALYSSSQIPACVACNGSIEYAELAAVRRAAILVGNVKP